MAQAARTLRIQGSAWLSTRAAMSVLRDCDLFLLDQSGQHDALAWALQRPLKHWQDIVDCLLGDALSREQPGIEADLAQQSSSETLLAAHADAEQRMDESSPGRHSVLLLGLAPCLPAQAGACCV